MMELILFFTSNNDLRGLLKDQNCEKEVFCKKLKEKTKTGADKYACFIVGSKIRIGTIVIGESSGTARIGASEGKIVGKGYFGEAKLDVVKFKSKKGKDYLRLIELPEL